MNAPDRLSIGMVLTWLLVIAATLTGTMMIVIGLFEDLRGIVRTASLRSFWKRRM